MTVGQRIAQKRKELGLSQETLGEQLGVSRQAIYKWESDATLPEIEKLIALSRIFSVSVGWLLGVEEETAEAESAGNGSGELTEAQMRMVKEIVDGYLAAQPQPEPQPLPKRRRWPKVLGAVACITLVAILVNLFDRLDSLSNQYNNLQYSISNIQSNVSSQIGSITDRVEDVLKSQNNLTSDYSTEFVSIDETGTMATFSWRARPKTYEEGMVAWVDIENGDYARITYGPYDPIREIFSGEFTIALTDHTAIYVVFEYANGVKENQLLDTYQNLYTYSFPSVYPDTLPLFLAVDDNSGILTEDLSATLSGYDSTPTQVTSYRIGLFANQELVAWFTPGTRTVNYMNGDGTVTVVEEDLHTLSPDGIVLDREKVYCVAAVIIDQYGREFIEMDTPVYYRAGEGWTYRGSYSSGPFFEGWSY